VWQELQQWQVWQAWQQRQELQQWHFFAKYMFSLSFQ
jgi:hypothetical protein